MAVLDVDVVQFLADLDTIEQHAEDQRPSEGDDERGRVGRATMVLSEYVLQRSGVA